MPRALTSDKCGFPLGTRYQARTAAYGQRGPSRRTSSNSNVGNWRPPSSDIPSSAGPSQSEAVAEAWSAVQRERSIGGDAEFTAFVRLRPLG